MRAQHRFASIFIAIVAALYGSAHADVGVTLKKLTWDPRQPDSTPYQDAVLGAVVSQVLAKAWTDMRPTVIHNVVAAITQKPLGSGISLYDVDLRLPSDLFGATVVAGGPISGALRLSLNGNVMEFKATHPLTTRDTDPRMRVTFDLTIDLAFFLNGNKHPPIEIGGATPRASNVSVKPLNAPALLGIAISDIEAVITNGANFTDRVAYGIDNSARGMTGTVTSYLTRAAAQLDIPPGYKYNGGHVDPGRITIAAWQPKSLPTANISVQAAWDGKYGLLLPNCDPLGLRVTLPNAPPPFGQTKHIDSDSYPTSTPGSVQSGKDYACSQTIAGVQGVVGTLLYKENVVDPSHPREPGYDMTVRAVPVNWSNPLLVGDATRGKAQFRLDVKEIAHDGTQQRSLPADGARQPRRSGRAEQSRVQSGDARDDDDQPGCERNHQPGVAARAERISHRTGRQRRAQPAAAAAWAARTAGSQQGASEGDDARVIARHAPIRRCRRRHAAERARQVSAS